MKTQPMNPRLMMTAKGNQAEVLLYGAFDSDPVRGISAQNFAEQLRSLGDGIQQLDVRLNSPGGAVPDALSIYNLLKDHPAKVVMHVDGVAVSCGSLVAMAGDEIKVASNALMMLHNPSGYTRGGAAEMRKMADVLDRMKDSIVEIYATRTGQSREQISSLMDAETWLSATEAVAQGFATTQTPNKAVTASFDTDQFQNMPDWCRAAICSAANNVTEETPMPEVTSQEAQTVAAAQVQAAAPDLNQVRDEAAAAEHKRLTDIHALCQVAKLPEDQKREITNRLTADRKLTVEDARRELFDAMCKSNPSIGTVPTNESAQPDADAEYRREYRNMKDGFEKVGVTENEYVATRRVDDGKDALRPKMS